jgi:hypothetical protein
MFWSRLIDRLTLDAGTGLVKVNRLVLRTRLRRRVDGWRRAMGLLLRGEDTMFVLSALDLDVWSDSHRPPQPGVEATQEHLGHRLDEFFAGEPTVHVCVRRGASEDRAEACDGPSYTLGFEPPREGLARFVHPDDWRGADRDHRLRDRSAVPLLNVVCRVDGAGRADVWVRVNHVGGDGVPVQEVMTRLAASFGFSEDLRYPSPPAFAPYSIPLPCAGRPELAEVTCFIDFAPLQAWRRQENARLSEPMTVCAAILWRLAHHAAFAGLHMGTTADVRAIDGMGRGVGLIVFRPRDYFDRRDGLAQYVSDFNRELELTRQRASAGWKSTDEIALLPTRFAKALLYDGIKRGTEGFGSLVVTMVKDARIFGAPIGDVGWADGIISIGSIDLPAAEGGNVGCVSVKGPADRIAEYPRILQEVIRNCPAASQTAH